MFAGLLLAIAAGVIIGVVIAIAVLKLVDLIKRIKVYANGKVAEIKIKRALKKAIEEEAKNGNTKKLSEMMGANDTLIEQYGDNAVVEAHVLDNGKVDPKSIKILKIDEIDEKVEEQFNENDGAIIIDPTC